MHETGVRKQARNPEKASNEDTGINSFYIFKQEGAN